MVLAIQSAVLVLGLVLGRAVLAGVAEVLRPEA